MSEVLIISTCIYPLLEEEFVRPLGEIAESLGYSAEVRSCREKIRPECSRVIISGTALKDLDYLNYVENFRWLTRLEERVLGIGAGAQIISLIFGCRLKERKLIGVYEVEVLGGRRRAYFLVSKIPRLNEEFEVLGRVGDKPAYFKKRGREIYGMLFHPEVLNRDLLANFLKG
ncbi:MAG: hypothetical protein J7L17_04625 [Thaumarchaeota archaeon]|nr:hypothetical protein [Nitrososphaerota archaeon]